MSALPTLAQNVTPQLRAWLRAQASLGHTVQTMLEAMRTAGWQTGVARDVIATTLQIPASGALPRLDQDGALQLDAGDRQVDVLLQMRRPRLAVLGNLLSDAECSALIKAARPSLARSLTVAVKTGGEVLSHDRTSSGMFFTRGENALVARIEARIARLLNWPVENGEGLQVLRYLPGAEYKPHHDYFDPAEPGTPTILQRGGQRVATLVMYLQAPAQGGATVFPELGLEVLPQRGHAVFFSYDRPDASTLSLHGGAPVLAGEKWVATKWLRERQFI
ncbi:2OG-Fe(II) oxygenase [Polaromonas sp.]|uniref:2OG-Fe(II) oxygenase n=1 Tax=Polaromonas sp. TaxID=1869339 RepID=UPI0027305717|nr:2OG-Fe(II) oxygenase [Polaromonas sp.]MDP1739638.1 2OG-Fe(II) oxygenase [Polaromonas sp.]